MPEYIRTALQPSRKHGRESKTKSPQHFIRPRSSLIIRPFEPLVLGWFRKPKASATGMSESATPSSPSWIHATLFFFQGFHTACNQLVDQRLQRGKRLLSNIFVNNALCEKHDSRMGKNKWRRCANIATQILQMPKQLRTHRRILPPLLLLPLFQYRPLRSPSLGFPKRYKDCWNHSLKNTTETQIKHHKKTFHLLVAKICLMLSSR